MGRRQLMHALRAAEAPQVWRAERARAGQAMADAHAVRMASGTYQHHGSGTWHPSAMDVVHSKY